MFDNLINSLYVLLLIIYKMTDITEWVKLNS